MAPDVMGTFVSGGYNLIGMTNGMSGFTNGATSDLLGSANVPVNAMLGPLQDNGGPTFTHALKLDSPALDQGNSNGLATDQRGQPRPFDFSSVIKAGDGCDIGAFELGSPRLYIQHAGNNVVLYWPSYYSGFTLESATNSPASNNWNAVTNTPKIVGNYFNVTNVTTDEGRLYRLTLP